MRATVGSKLNGIIWSEEAAAVVYQQAKLSRERVESGLFTHSEKPHKLSSYMSTKSINKGFVVCLFLAAFHWEALRKDR